MALFDKIKQAASTAKEKAENFAEEKQLGEKFSNMKDGIKNLGMKAPQQ